MIENIEAKKLESIRQRQLWLEQERKNYLSGKRANIGDTEKLLKISQENPELWREIQADLYEVRLREEQERYQNQARSMVKGSTVGIAKTDGKEIDVNTHIDLMNDGMKHVMSNLGGQMARDTEARLGVEESKAAEKIQKTYRDAKGSKACSLF